MGLKRLFTWFVLVFSVSGGLATPVLSGEASAATRGKPNIVLILTDDQRWDSLWAMPHVKELLQARGRTFDNGFVVNPLCCPSRTTILTGKYSHSTGVYSNQGPHGGFGAFHSRVTIATQLNHIGYRTALIGKYLNGYTNAARHGYIPSGWDRWFAFAEDNGHYFDYDISDDGHIRHFAHAPRDYSTDVLANQAVKFIRNNGGPLFLYWAPSAPHAPYTPAPRYAHAFPSLAPHRPPNFDETDMRDKPRWLRAHQDLGPRAADNMLRRTYQTLLSVDDAVKRIVDALRATGRLSNTMIVFMGDNGHFFGEHRLHDKRAAYEESIRVPFVVRYDPITASGPRVDHHFVLNMDLAPTWAALTGTTAPGAEGRNLLPLLRSPGIAWRHQFLVEHSPGDDNIPSYCAVRTEAAIYIRYDTGEEELYDLKTDPYELHNLVPVRGGARPQEVRAPHGKELTYLRGEWGRKCRPRPPGF